MSFLRTKFLLGSFCSLIALAAAPKTGAQQSPAGNTPEEVPTVVVTATRIQEPSFDLPISIDAIGRSDIADQQLQENLSEALVSIPGIVIHNRQNYAQDLQISIRGFGARSTFGVRGIRVYVDNIPSTQPDGQGQVSNIDLGSVDHIEVLRGPFSALYGNSAGGVISAFTQDGMPGMAIDGIVEYGSFSNQRAALKLSGDTGNFNYVVNGADFHTDGSRAHSAAGRGNFNTKMRLTLDDDSQLTFTANAMSLNAQDPLGLTRAQYNADPRQTGTGSEQFNTRKSADQEQFGLNYVRQFGDNDTLAVLAYGGNRAVRQYQSIPLTTQAPASSPGGVIDLGVGYWGADIHWTDRRSFGSTNLRVTGGLTYDDLDSARKGYLNFVGSTFGLQGALRRDESDLVYDLDPYLQAEFEPDEHWLIVAGVRNSQVHVTSRDHYIVPGNGDDSGGVTYRATTPVGGITYKVTPDLNFYASYGRGFQTPALDELAYRSTSSTLTGLNLGLQPSKSDNYEIGVKARITDSIKANLAGFHIDTTNELAVQANTSGRSVYQNVSRTNRDGIEASVEGRWNNGIAATLAYTYVRATYASRFTSCPGLPCVPTIIPAGNRMPGVPLNSAYGELSWKDEDSGFSVGLEGRLESRLYVNDPNTDATPFYAVANLRAGLEQKTDGWNFKEFIRIDNLADRKYAGSVIVNESNSRFFEPAPGRAVYAGISAHFGG